MSPPPRVHYGYIILIAGFLTVTGALGFARFGYATILPAMKAGLELNNTQMGLIATGNLVGYTVFAVIGGYLAARFGPRLIIGCSMLATGVAMFLTGLSGGFVQAVALRFLAGLGSAGANVPVMGLLAAWFAPNRRGLASGILVGGSGLAFVVAGLLVPAVVETRPEDGWRLAWFILGGIVVLLGVLGYALLRNRPSEKGLAPIGCSNQGIRPENGFRDTVRSKTEPEPERPAWRRVYTSPALWHLGAVYFCFGFSYIIFGTFFVEAMVADKGVAQAEAGTLWSSIGFLGIFSGILWGAASDHIGRRSALAVVFALQAGCYFLFATAHTAGTLYLSSALFGLTAFSIPGIVAAACGDYVGSRMAPAALGMVTFFFAVGQALAPTAAGYLADVTHSLSAAFVLAGVIAGLGSVGSLTLRPRQALL